MTAQGHALAFLKGFALTQSVEILVVLFLLGRHFRSSCGEAASFRIAAAAFFANMATLPYLWFVYPELLDYAWALAAGEATALAAEAIFYRLFLGASARAALAASFAANAASVLAGLLVMPPFG